jgi:hypothetical protein
MTTTDEGHHTPEQVARAFSRAPEVLRQLKEAGADSPRITLFSDASGRLSFGSQRPTPEQATLATSLVHSQRWSSAPREYAIDFCCGLVEHDA